MEAQKLIMVAVITAVCAVGAGGCKTIAALRTENARLQGENQRLELEGADLARDKESLAELEVQLRSQIEELHKAERQLLQDLAAAEGKAGAVDALESQIDSLIAMLGEANAAVRELALALKQKINASRCPPGATCAHIQAPGSSAVSVTPSPGPGK